MLKTASLTQVALLACLGLALLGRPAASGAAHPPAGPAQAAAATGAVPVPTPVIAGLAVPPAHGYRDAQGTYHSVVAPYTVRSHWRAGEVGGPAPVERNDRFTAAIAPPRYIDVIAVPNTQRVDSARAERSLWAYLTDTGMQPHIVGRVRVRATWLPLIGLTNLDTGQPHARLVFATAQAVWVLDLATGTGTWSRDVAELTYVAATFCVAPGPGAPAGPSCE